MKRRDFIAGIASASIGWPTKGGAQQSGRLRQIGALLTGVDSRTMGAFRQELERLGWVEGRNIHIEERGHGGDPDRMQAYASELVKSFPDVIVGTSPIEAKALQRHTSKLPIVFAAGVDPVSQGVVESLTRPGGNITGCSSFDFSLGGKWVQNLKEIAPNTKKMGIAFNPQTAPYMESIFRFVNVAAKSLQIEILSMPVLEIAEIERAVASLQREPGNAMIFPPDVFLSAKVRAIIALMAQYRMPAAYSVPSFARSGGLLAYGPDFYENYRRVARLVDRIFKGAKPADLPVEQPTKYELVVNLTTAKALGLRVPPEFLVSADEVIE